MIESITNKTIVIFSKSASARDHLRTRVMANGGTAFCFEREATCFDNLESINPHVVLAMTDSASLVWRFVFAIQTLGAKSALLVLSDVLKCKSFSVLGLHVLVRCFPDKSQGNGLNATMDEIISGKPKQAISNIQRPFLGETAAVKSIRSMLPGLMSAQEPLLISGEPGTGKELLARIVAGGTHGAQVVIKVNCAEVGVGKGVHTGLFPMHGIDKQNKLFQSDKLLSKPATILLDKINRLHQDAQGEILMLLDGDLKTIHNLDWSRSNSMRFIATSEEKLEPLVRRGKFRKDLYYRLNVIPIHIQPLRERITDIPLLLDYFTIEACAKSKKSFIIPTDSLKEHLSFYGWPGNVDELRQLMHRIAISGDESFIFSQYGMESIPKDSQAYLLKSINIAALPDSMDIKSVLPTMNNLSLKRICEEFVSRTEKKLMQNALHSTNWNRKKAAQLLNISYKSMLNKMKAYDIV